MTDFAFRAAAGSVVGRRYSDNFDVVHLGQEPLLAVVADGMGDGEGSRTAGRTTVDVVIDRIRTAGNTLDAATLRAAVAEAQVQVAAAGRRIGQLTGCTLTALAASPAGLWLVQIGDSRGYRLRNGLLEQLTVDHTMAWLGAVNGWYPFDSPEAHSARYQLTRYVGHNAHPEPDVLNIAPRPGDILLLGSDGLTDQVPYSRISEVLQWTATPGRQVRELLADTEKAGGDDNATAVIVHVAPA
ncbi:Protein serine/threonine phosphatase PrpC [Amycolatopsis camponoti]|uniref:Protein serine/threonine phosphatase PrpC n=1 Tax=Amycolatopsis camponoti TaxID=2606593 RepID=A0A6I8MA04_9PSEU|nr:PP2C family serine/threonine-protein phosphatase [Amycolatopsis camponoti]VVJ24920.1 Protein serine/threonine phosphatase PrpC [Amycolatopsis camponoti]